MGVAKSTQLQEECGKSLRPRSTFLAVNEGKIDKDETQLTRKEDTYYQYSPKLMKQFSKKALKDHLHFFLNLPFIIIIHHAYFSKFLTYFILDCLHAQRHLCFYPDTFK